MNAPPVLLLKTSTPLVLGGLTLAERTVKTADRLGLRVTTWTLDRGTSAEIDAAAAAVVVEGNVLFSPGVLAGVATALRSSPDVVHVVKAGEVPVLLALPAGAVSDVASCRSIASMVEVVSRRRVILEWPLAGEFVRVVDRQADAPSVEREYIRHLNGKESYFTKKIRRFSVPLSSRLVLIGARPTHVTTAGLVLAAVSAWCLGQGHYALGVLGGALYYTSMIFDCSDGEVARLTMRDSPFGAWFETIVDYSTYVMLWVALTVSSHVRPDGWALERASSIAAVGSIVVIAAASFLRYHVAKADPGQFDEASARALAETTRLNRFARWGRQWIKRSTLAHLVLVLALVNQAPLLLYLWAFGATVAAIVIVAVQPFVSRRVLVKPTHV